MVIFTVAIDGPAAAGKGTISRAVAERFGFAHLDTGALYRAVAAARQGDRSEAGKWFEQRDLGTCTSQHEIDQQRGNAVALVLRAGLHGLDRLSRDIAEQFAALAIRNSCVRA